MARPSEYTQEKADKICELLACGMSLRSVCNEDGMPDAATVFKWMRTNEEFLKQYARAKQESADAMAEEILDISDQANGDWMTRKIGKEEVQVANNEAIQRSRLRVDTRKWLMSKMKPKKYGEKLDMTTNGKDLPVPLLHAIRTENVPDHHSNEEDSSAS